MSTLDINTSKSAEQLRKTIGVYFILSVAAIVVDKVYGMFSHGVDSPAMTWMFLYPLFGGALFFLIIGTLIPHITNFAGFRVFLNAHSSGIATLTLARLLKGVFEIAGTNSKYLVYFNMVGWGFIAVGLIIIFTIGINQNRFR